MTTIRFDTRIIEEQKKGIYTIIAKLDNGSHSSSQLQGVDEALWNWHKQSLKQFIDELIASEQEYVDIINKNDNGTKFRTYRKTNYDLLVKTGLHIRKKKYDIQTISLE